MHQRTDITQMICNVAGSEPVTGLSVSECTIRPCSCCYHHRSHGIFSIFHHVGLHAGIIVNENLALLMEFYDGVPADRERNLEECAAETFYEHSPWWYEDDHIDRFLHHGVMRKIAADAFLEHSNRQASESHRPTDCRDFVPRTDKLSQYLQRVQRLAECSAAKCLQLLNCSPGQIPPRRMLLGGVKLPLPQYPTAHPCSGEPLHSFLCSSHTLVDVLL